MDSTLSLKPHDQAAQGYSRTATQTGAPRSIELQAFQRATAMLSRAAAKDAPFTAKAEAIYLNTRLWLALATDVLSPQNGLPEELRAQIFNLAEFSRKQGMLALSGEAELEPLISVNTTIMRGLRGEGAPEPASTPPRDAAATPALATR